MFLLYLPSLSSLPARPNFPYAEGDILSHLSISHINCSQNICSIINSAAAFTNSNARLRAMSLVSSATRITHRSLPLPTHSGKRSSGLLLSERRLGCPPTFNPAIAVRLCDRSNILIRSSFTSPLSAKTAALLSTAAKDEGDRTSTFGRPFSSAKLKASLDGYLFFRSVLFGRSYCNCQLIFVNFPTP